MTRSEKPIATVMFADICRSTYLFSKLGDMAAAALIQRALNSASAIVESNGGKVLRTQGDDIFCLFARAGNALKSALDIHRNARTMSELEMRIGINTGPVFRSGKEILGDTVNIAARLCDIAKGGQTLVTPLTAQDLKAIPPGPFRSLGEVHIKGKSSPLSLLELLDEEQQDEITQVGPARRAAPASNRLSIEFQGRAINLDYRLVRFLLGRHDDCDLVLDNHLVSRHHAEIRYVGKDFVLTDFSTNGTLVIRDGQRRMLQHGQIALRGRGSIFLGRTQYSREFEINFHTGGSVR
ncbi:MAG: adenylate/guanylate cyclase domain-containing protein [Xanthomonadales bacterium]|jgi:class 3 adenylate cyclase|nr:adenylate/guanylate cyclase domain-containing protein [Xanthomonadales bacterium]